MDGQRDIKQGGEEVEDNEIPSSLEKWMDGGKDIRHAGEGGWMDREM